MTSRRNFLGGVAALKLLSAGAANATGEPARGGILRVAIGPEQPHLNSAFYTHMHTGMLSTKIVEGLVSYDLDLNPVPALAESWQVAEDGLSIIFNLRRGVKWHDGKDFTAADVAYTMTHVWKRLNSYGRAAFANVTAVETPDAHTAIFRLSAPASYILSSLNGYAAQILPRHIYEGTDIAINPANIAPIGTGPFVFREWVRGSHIRLERNPAYWQPGKPYLDGVIFRVIPDAAARAIALESGEVDVVYSALPLSSLDRFADANRFQIIRTDGLFLGSIFLAQINTRRPYFADRRARQALLHALDREALLRVVWRGYGKLAAGPVPSSVVRYFTGDTPQYPYDPRRAEQLLDEAGLGRGAGGRRFAIKLDYRPGSAEEARAAEFIKQYLGRVGIDVDLRLADSATWVRRVYTELDYDLVIPSLHMLADPTLGVQRLYWTKNIIVGAPYSNSSGYSNPELDRIMEAAQVEADEARRRALIHDWQRIAQQDLPILDLIEQTWLTVASARYRKLAPQGDGLFATLADAYLLPGA